MLPLAGGLLLKALLAGAVGTYLSKTENARAPKVFDNSGEQEGNTKETNEAIVRNYKAKGIEVPDNFVPVIRKIQEKDKIIQEAKPQEEINKDKIKNLLFNAVSNQPQTGYGVDTRLTDLSKAKAAFAEQRKFEKDAYDAKLARIMNNYDFGLLTTKERDEAIKALKASQSEFNESDFIKNIPATPSFGPSLFLPNAPK